jgi:type IV pilus assembly protein PilE
MNMNEPIALGCRRVMVVTTKGFTLIELMITVTIVAILAAIAIPSYSHYTLKAHRTEAKSALLDMASLEERYFNVNNVYTADPTQLGYTGAVGSTFTVGSGYYTVTIPATAITAPGLPTAALPGGTPATYAITAVATGTQVNDTECAQFTINSQGLQTSVNSGAVATTDCWQ